MEKRKTKVDPLAKTPPTYRLVNDRPVKLVAHKKVRTHIDWSPDLAAAHDFCPPFRYLVDSFFLNLAARARRPVSEAKMESYHEALEVFRFFFFP